MADPIGVSGMFMAGLTFPAQMFSSGVVAYTTISQVRHMGGAFNTLYWLFKLQESRYIIWGMSHKACSPGGLDPSQMPSIVYQTIVQALIQINSLLEGRDSLCQRYVLKEEGRTQPVAESIIRRESARQENEVKRLQKSSSLLRKVQWAVKDKDRFAELVQQLTDATNILYDILPVPGGPLVGETIAAETLADALINGGPRAVEGLQLATNSELQVLQQMGRAVASAVPREANETTTETQPVATSPYLMLDVRQLKIIELKSITYPASHLRSWARPISNNAFVGQELLVVEWRRFDPKRGLERLKVILHRRIAALVMMLKEKPRTDSFRVFDCLGYFEDNLDSRFGLAFRLPLYFDQEKDTAPMSLSQAISLHQKDVPYLGERFRLAYLLAESLHALHATRWLHRNISSHNILLLQKTSSPSASSDDRQRRVSLENPYFTGFASSRPDAFGEESSRSAADMEMALSSHPDVQGFDGRAVAGYRALYDIYSLGTVLVEIGTWRCLSQFCPKHAPPSLNFQKVLLEKAVPYLGASMGERYMVAARKCLEGSFDRLVTYGHEDYNSEGYKDKVREALLWEVVTVLRDCRV